MVNSFMIETTEHTEYTEREPENGRHVQGRRRKCIVLFIPVFFPCIPCVPWFVHVTHQYTTGAAKTMESTTSRTPPKPGTACEASFFWQSRLTSDSARSPRMPTSPTTRPNATADSQPEKIGPML